MIRLLEKRARKPSVLVATFHRIGDPEASPFYHGVFSASPEAFRAEVMHLRDRFRLISMDELVALADSGFEVDRPTALITFDDGYRDNLEVALPILEELGAPATFFIPTGFFDEPKIPWWDHVAYVMKRSGRERLVLDWPEAVDIELTPGARIPEIMRVIGLYLDGKIDDEARFRAYLEERAKVVVDEAALGSALFMGWEGVRRLVSSGMTVGAHSRSHRRLSSLSEDEQRDELEGSKKILEREVGREVTTIAYPFGWAGTYDERTLRLTREAGYRLAFTSREGLNLPGSSRALELARLNIGYHDSPPLLRARMALQAALGKSIL
ncbi:polysaccharide deacetylase family protein [Singulisphaera sp. PoT]|uniref:polysaccharide deacetylase family protein n=1 Tax=Singulisphaera sp. PoT TaxID=3411797 RepID=UPI003BF5B6D2